MLNGNFHSLEYRGGKTQAVGAGRGGPIRVVKHGTNIRHINEMFLIHIK